MKNNQTRSGFSLIEVLVVLIVIGTVMALVISNPFERLEEEELVDVLNDIKTAVRKASHDSVIRQKELVLKFHLADNKITLEELPEREIDDNFTSSDKREERHQYYKSNKGVILETWEFTDRSRISGVYRDNKVQDSAMEMVLFSPDGTSESFRVKVEFVQSGSELAFELRGLMGRFKEVPVDQFDQEWDDIDFNQNPPVIKFEEFFEASFLESLANQQAQGVAGGAANAGNNQ